MPVKTLPRYLMKASEITIAAERLIQLCAKLPESSPMIEAVVEKAKEDVAAVRRAYGTEAAPGLAARARLADESRDESCVQLTGLLRGLQYHFDSEVADSAETVYSVLARHDLGARRSSYENQSMVTAALLDDLAKPEIKEAVDRCGVAPAIADLKEKEEAFRAIIMSRIEASSEADEPALRELVEPLRAAIFEILVMVESRERLNPEMYRDFVADLNGMITEIGSKVRARKSRREAADEAPPVAS
jgi:hypothetical protein